MHFVKPDHFYMPQMYRGDKSWSLFTIKKTEPIKIKSSDNHPSTKSPLKPKTFLCPELGNKKENTNDVLVMVNFMPHHVWSYGIAQQPKPFPPFFLIYSKISFILSPVWLFCFKHLASNTLTCHAFSALNISYARIFFVREVTYKSWMCFVCQVT